MKRLFILVVVFTIFLSSSICQANETLIEASGSYVMDSRLDETPASATARAREEAKRAAVEKAGVYLRSYSKTVNFELDTDIVETVAARLLKIQSETSTIEVVEKNLLLFTVTIQAFVDELNESDLRAMMNDRQLLNELTRRNKELQEKYDFLQTEIKKYRDEFDTANAMQRSEIKRNVARNSKNFSAVEAMARGNDFYFAKDLRQALSAYNEAIELNPQLAEAYNNRGIVKYEQGQYITAIDDYTTAINLKQNFADALNNRGNAYAVTNQFQKATQDLQAALKLKESATIRNNLGSVYLLQRNYDAAINEYSRAIKVNPQYAEAFYNRALAYYEKGNFVQSFLDIKSAVSLKPGDTSILELYKKINNTVL